MMKIKKRFLLFSIIFTVTILTLIGSQGAGQESLTLYESMSERERTEFDLLNSTLNEPIGMQGFEGDYALNYSDDFVEIIVQFVTPPSEAFRLSYERDIPLPPSFPGETFEEQALRGHATFQEQLEQITVPPSVAPVEIFSANHLLFNGVFMRVSPSMVEQITALPEVFGVFPNMATSAPEIMPTSEPTLGAGVVNPNFMLETRQLFNTDYIHNEMGLTGEGITVAVIDSGIYHGHPEFAAYIDPTTGRIPGFCFIQGIDDPAEIPGQSDFGHGTHVSGTVIAVAPGANHRSYRVLGSGGTWQHMVDAIEAAHLSSDIMNLSIHSNFTNIHFFANYALNLAALGDTVVVVIAGNFAQGPPPHLSVMASASLPIIVGAGTAGGRNQAINGDTIATFSSRVPVPGIYHIAVDIVAPGVGIYSTIPGGGYQAWQGTSMAAPNIAGVAALMLDAFPDAGSYEIKARMMNTSRPLADLNPNSVFTEGAGFVQPIEALTSQSFVTTAHPIPWSPSNPFVEGTVSSLSFGSLGAILPTNTRTFRTSIHNESNEPVTYTIDDVFLNNPNTVAIITLSQRTITIEPGQTEDFYIGISVAGNVIGNPTFYEGYVYISGDHDDMRLPFALVNTSTTNIAASRVNFDLQGGVVSLVTPDLHTDIDPINVLHGANILTFLADNHNGFTNPTRGDYTFAGWYLDSNFTTPVTNTTVMPEEEMTLYARFIDDELSPREILRELIVEAEARNQSYYTPRSWANMMSRLVMARSIYNNPNATEAQINEANALLRGVLDALVER